MAYHDTNLQKLKKLFDDPLHNFGKILPFIKSHIVPHQRDLYEFFGSVKYSTPYPDHAKLLKYINIDNGFFIQCGGNDGYFQDPTYYLEKFKGWKGIIVEPLPISRLCQRNRKNSEVVQCACVSSEYTEKTLSLIDCNAMSFVKDSLENSAEWIKLGEEAQDIKSREIIVPACTIQSIIDKCLKSTQNVRIDLFVIDVEGYELEILHGISFYRNPPTYVLLEAQTIDKLEKITTFLKNYEYSLIDELGEKDFLFQRK